MTQLGKTPTMHGGSRTPEYAAWRSMKQRCRNPKVKDYADYGGRGIAMCERWGAFANFLADMGTRPSRRHSLDRIDNNAGYFPENCRWATVAEQQRNRRSTRMAPEKVRAVREMGQHGVTQKEIASRFSISQPTVSKILGRVLWADVI